MSQTQAPDTSHLPHVVILQEEDVVLSVIGPFPNAEAADRFQQNLSDDGMIDLNVTECAIYPIVPPGPGEDDGDEDQCPECARSFGPHYRGPCDH